MFERTIGIYVILYYIALIIIFISIITIAINSIIISSRLKKINYKLIEMDLHNKEDTTELCNEIRKIPKI